MGAAGAAAAADAGSLKIGDLRLSPEARIDRYETKAGFEISTDYYG